MKTKVCNTCKIEKPLEDFHKDKSNKKDGRQYKCKICKTQYAKNNETLKENRKIYRKKNEQKIKEDKKQYRKNNKEKIAEKDKIYREANKEKLSAKKKQYWQENREDLLKKKKEYRQKNKEKITKSEKYHYENNKEQILVRQKKYYETNKEKILEKNKEYKKNNKEKLNQRLNERRNTDIQYKLAINLRSRLYQALKNNYKVGSAVQDLGCNISEFKVYLESLFQEDMSWDNYGKDGWHIDHIKPLASFDLTNREQLLEACHFTNLQPLWAKDNLSKGAKID